jgi:hypothetical protein
VLVVDALVAIALADETVCSRTGSRPLGLRFFALCMEQGFDVSEYASALLQHCRQFTI